MFGKNEKKIFRIFTCYNIFFTIKKIRNYSQPEKAGGCAGTQLISDSRELCELITKS